MIQMIYNVFVVMVLVRWSVNVGESDEKTPTLCPIQKRVEDDGQQRERTHCENPLI